MKLFPAIDIRAGQAVRLYQGDYDRMTVYNPDPVAQAEAFLACGAQFLHVVDLDGAAGVYNAQTRDAIAAIAAKSGVFTEVGGGIRDEYGVRQYLNLGVDRCILGTAAVKDFSFTQRMVQKYGAKIAVGVDIKGGMVAISGWREITQESGLTFSRRCASAGVKALIVTDISRDGTLHGANLELYREMLAIPGVEITASGGIQAMEELEALNAMGCHAAILGRSLYTGAIDLCEALLHFAPQSDTIS